MRLLAAASFCDERPPDREHPLVVLPLLVELPLHAQDERRRTRHLDGLDRPVRRPGDGFQAGPQILHRLVVVAVDLVALSEVRRQERARLHDDGVRRVRGTF